MAQVAFKNVSKRFDEDTLALRDFSLNIDDGELVVLVGPSGCGKSTVLRLLAGLEETSSGEIFIDNKLVNQTTPQKRNIAMVFQNYALYPHMTVRTNLEFPLRMKHEKPQLISDKIKYIADILNLSDLLERKPKQLSGGQRQRVAMGRALVRNPSVFLLDEPLSNLDAKLRARIRTDIVHLQKHLRKTTLYVTHDQVEAMTLGDRVAVMNMGELQQVGTPDELYERPQNIFVARFIGSPGMNIISSSLIITEDGINATIDNKAVKLPESWQHASEMIKNNMDEKIFLGIRPEAFLRTQEENKIGVRIKILSTEYIGHESLVYFQLQESKTDQNDNILIARVAGRFDDESHSDGMFYFNTDKLYLFDINGNIIKK